MYCSNCGNPIDPQAGYCTACGSQQGLSTTGCPVCGASLVPGATVCAACGCSVPVITPRGRKSMPVAALLCFFLGGIGIHDFYLGYVRNGILKIILTCCTGFGGSLWALIDFIRLLTGSLNTDASGGRLRKEF